MATTQHSYRSLHNMITWLRTENGNRKRNHCARIGCCHKSLPEYRVSKDGTTILQKKRSQKSYHVITVIHLGKLPQRIVLSIPYII